MSQISLRSLRRGWNIMRAIFLEIYVGGLTVLAVLSLPQLEEAKAFPDPVSQLRT